MSATYVPCRSLDGDQRRWYAYLIVSVVPPFVLAVPFVFWAILSRLTLKGNADRSRTLWPALTKLSLNLGNRASLMASDQTVVGQILKLLGVIFAFASLVIYWRDATPPCQDVEMCHKWKRDGWWIADLAFNSYFAGYWAIRFLAAQNKLAFIFDVYSVADYFNFPPTFVAIGLNRNWLGLRYLRVINWMWIVDLLHRRRILHNAAQVQLARLSISIAVAVFVGAGSFMLLECSGDPWNIEASMQLNMTYWQYVYYSVVTLSTVGYGDMYPKTVLGRIFCCFYIFACLFFIASFIATAASLVPPARRYPKFEQNQYVGHVLLCGSVNHTSVKRFIEEFYEDTVRSLGIYTVILHPDNPDDEMVLLLQYYQNHVEYVRGSPLEDHYLEKSRAKFASSCIIMADGKAVDPDSEDACHIMEVVAIKNFCPTLRVQIQVIKPSSMVFLKSYPAMDFNSCDVVICQQAMEMAFIGMNCAVPGFSTLFCDLVLSPNLLASDPAVVASMPPLYVRGCNMDLFCIPFSSAFYGWTVPDVVELCFDKWNIILIGVYTRGKTPNSFKHVMPNATKDALINNTLMAQVIAPSRQHAAALEIFCRNCHMDTRHPETMKSCHCNNNATMNGVQSQKANSVKLLAHGVLETQLSLLETIMHDRRQSSISPVMSIKNDSNPSEDQLDSTGMFYWQPQHSFEDAVLNSDEITKKHHFQGHVVIFVLSAPGTAPLGLYNILRPLRSSSSTYAAVPDIVIVGYEEKLRQEWGPISMLPKVHLLPGDPAMPPVIRLAQLETCRSCSVISTPGASGLDHLVDKETVIMTLQLRGLQSSFLSDQIRGVDIPILTHLDNEKSIRYLSQESSATQYNQTVPHMAGQVLASTTLESLIIPAYYTPSLMRLCSILIFGGISSELERVETEGPSLKAPSAMSLKTLSNGYQLRSTMKMADLDSDRYRNFIDLPFADLFLFALREYGIICIGLYRVFDQAANDDPNWKWGNDTRYVATNPPANLILKRTDKLYLLLPAIVM